MNKIGDVEILLNWQKSIEAAVSAPYPGPISCYVGVVSTEFFDEVEADRLHKEIGKVPYIFNLSVNLVGVTGLSTITERLIDSIRTNVRDIGRDPDNINILGYTSLRTSHRGEQYPRESMLVISAPMLGA